MVHAAQVKRSVDDRLPDVVRPRGTNDDVAELSRSGRRTVLVDAERQHVRRLVELPMIAVQRTDSFLVDELDRDVAVVDPSRREGQCAQLL